MDSPIVRSSEEYCYQRRLALLLAEAYWRPEVSIGVSPGLLALHENFTNLYCVKICYFWSREFFFESLVRERQNIFGR